MTDKYIIFLNDEIKGYLNTEEETKKKVYELSDYLENHELKVTNVPIRILKETIDNCGINIYTQIIGNYINGSLYLKHVIKWKCVKQYNQN